MLRKKKAKNAIATQIVDRDLSALDTLDLKNGEDEKEPKLKLASFADYGGANCQSETIHKAYSCAQCGHDTQDSQKTVLWEMLAFCDDICLSKCIKKLWLITQIPVIHTKILEIIF